MKYINTISLNPKQAEKTLVFKRYDPVSGSGYQRNICVNNVKRLTEVAEKAGSWVFPVINGVRHGDLIEVVDGQNRSLAAQLAGIETVVAVWEIDEEDRAKVFIDWNKSQPINKKHILNVYGLSKRFEKIFSQLGITFNPENSIRYDSIGASQASNLICMVAGIQGNFNVRLESLNEMSDDEMYKHAVTVSNVIKFVADNRSEDKFEPNLVRAICTLYGKVKMTEEHMHRICQYTPYVHSGNLDNDTKYSIIKAMDRHDLRTWPK